MDQSSFSNNIRSPCDSSTDFAPQDTQPFTTSERSVSQFKAEPEVELTKEEIDIVNQVEVLAFD